MLKITHMINTYDDVIFKIGGGMIISGWLIPQIGTPLVITGVILLVAQVAASIFGLLQVKMKQDKENEPYYKALQTHMIKVLEFNSEEFKYELGIWRIDPKFAYLTCFCLTYQKAEGILKAQGIKDTRRECALCNVKIMRDYLMQKGLLPG
jgi:hypothetical protein